MSEHTQGRLIVLNSFLAPEAHANRKIGGASDPKRDHDEYAHYIADVKGKRDYHNSEANARRLAAAWNACEGLSTENLESIVFVGETIRMRFGLAHTEISEANTRIAKLESLVAERDAMLGNRLCQNSRCLELNAARALLREVLEGEKKSILHYEIEKRVRSYLDACDTLEGK